MSVAIVMPEMGFEEEPMIPTMRDDTVTKMKPNTMTSSATSSFWRTELARDLREHDEQQRRARRCR